METMVLYGTCMDCKGFVWIEMVLYGLLWMAMILYGFVWILDFCMDISWFHF